MLRDAADDLEDLDPTAVRKSDVGLTPAEMAALLEYAKDQQGQGSQFSKPVSAPVLNPRLGYSFSSMGRQAAASLSAAVASGQLKEAVLLRPHLKPVAGVRFAKFDKMALVVKLTELGCVALLPFSKLLPSLQWRFRQAVEEQIMCEDIAERGLSMPQKDMPMVQKAWEEQKMEALKNGRPAPPTPPGDDYIFKSSGGPDSEKVVERLANALKEGLVGTKLDVIISLHKAKNPRLNQAPGQTEGETTANFSADATAEPADGEGLEQNQELYTRCIQAAAWPPAWMTGKKEQWLDQVVAAAGIGSGSSADWWLRLPEDARALWQEAQLEGQSSDEAGGGPDSQAVPDESPRMASQQQQQSSSPAAITGLRNRLLQQWRQLVEFGVQDNEPDLPGECKFSGKSYVWNNGVSTSGFLIVEVTSRWGSDHREPIPVAVPFSHFFPFTGVDVRDFHLPSKASSSNISSSSLSDIDFDFDINGVNRLQARRDLTHKDCIKIGGMSGGLILDDLSDLFVNARVILAY
eukprot:gene11187-11337_t